MSLAWALHDNQSMTSRLLSLFIWLVVAASATYWGLRLFIQPQPVPGQAVVAAGPAAAVGELSRLLGQVPVQAAAQPAQVAAESRFRLVGVVAPQGGKDKGQTSGLALISVDGKPPRTVAVGREVEPGLRLLSVSQRQADLGAGGSAPRLALSLPMLAEAQRGRPSDQSVNGGVPAQGLPGAAQGAVPGALLGQPGGLPANLPPGLAQRMQAQQQLQIQQQQQQMQLQIQQQQQQAGLPMRAMPAESAEENPAPNPATR